MNPVVSSLPPICRALAAAVLLAVSGLAQAQAVPAKLLPGSQLGFVSKQMGVPVEGQFKKFDAQIALDPKQPESGKVAFTIDLASATIGDKDTDAELPKAAWFNVAKFPQASFQSNAIKSVGPGRYEVTGSLSIKGSSSAVVVPVSVTQSGGTSTAIGSFAIKRLTFKIGEGEWADTSMVADDVQVKFKLLLGGLPAL